MDFSCNYVARGMPRCYQTTWANTEYCRWHVAARDIATSTPPRWRGFLGVFFLGAAAFWILSFVLHSWTLVKTGKESPVEFYGELCSICYFGSLGFLLQYESTKTFWAKTLFVSQVMYAVFYLGFFISNRTPSGIVDVANLTLGLLVALQVIGFIVPVASKYKKGPLYISLGLYILSIETQNIVWLCLSTVIILFAYLTELEFAWSERF